MAKPLTLSLLLPALLLAALTGLRAIGLGMPNAILFFCFAVVWAAFRCGTKAGLISAVAGILYAIPDAHHTNGLGVHHVAHLWWLLVPIIGLPLLAVFAARLRHETPPRERDAHDPPRFTPGTLLKGIILCAWCRRARAKDGGWKELETILHEEHGLTPTHGICPDCAPGLRSPAEHEVPPR